MARKTISRTFTESTIKVAEISFKDGTPVMTELESITVDGKPSMENAQRQATLAYRDHVKEKQENGELVQIAVTGIEEKEEYWSISVEDFKKYGTKAEEKTEENTEA